MTVLTLTKLWINRMDTDEAVSAYTGRDRKQSFSMDLTVRTYANGRRRSITTVGEVGEIPYTLELLDLTTVTLLRSWVGVNVQIRDHRGQKWFGVFAAVNVDEHFESTLYAATITLQTTTTVEGE